ncbi:hypothetical protein OG756_28695 [Streptomyces sp. NBC_01310]|uniref:hypothetical protein n=1 Tax=Streptomyces sp. NBC_01310 TaxID=2903820 RepID=UPI0035B6700A|nr:hypothetical protein OG756_28695 [Streptomyces sp. NBC_01310]
MAVLLSAVAVTVAAAPAGDIDWPSPGPRIVAGPAGDIDWPMPAPRIASALAGDADLR